MKNKLILIILGFVAILTILFLSSRTGESLDSSSGDILGDTGTRNRMRIAVCPTFYSLVDDLDTEKYEIVRTASTAENIILIESGEVEYMIPGRALAPWEPELDSIVLSDDESYSFIGLIEEPLYITDERNDLENFSIYTDQDPDRIEELFGVSDVNFVRDVYQHLEDGIIITSWGNTSYAQGIPVSILNEDGSRVAESRRGTLYCLDTCDTAPVRRLLNDIFNGKSPEEILNRF